MLTIGSIIKDKYMLIEMMNWYYSYQYKTH